MQAAPDGDCGHAPSTQPPETEETGDFELQPTPPMPPPSKQLQTDTQALPVDATVLFVALQYQLLSGAMSSKFALIDTVLKG